MIKYILMLFLLIGCIETENKIANIFLKVHKVSNENSCVTLEGMKINGLDYGAFTICTETVFNNRCK